MPYNMFDQQYPVVTPSNNPMAALGRLVGQAGFAQPQPTPYDPASFTTMVADTMGTPVPPATSGEDVAKRQAVEQLIRQMFGY